MNGVGRRVEDMSSWYELQEEPRSSNHALNTLMVYRCSYNKDTEVISKIQVAKINWNWNNSEERTQIAHIRSQSLWDKIPEELKNVFIRKMIDYWNDWH